MPGLVTKQEAVLRAENLDLSFLIPVLTNKIPNRSIKPNDLLREYKRFLAIKVIAEDTEAPFSLSPSAMVDQVWHQHILHTKQYRLTCTQFGVNIDHDPAGAGDPEPVREKRLKMTKAFYKTVFNEDAPDKYWKMKEASDPVMLKNFNEDDKKLVMTVEMPNGKNLLIACPVDGTVGTLRRLISKHPGSGCLPRFDPEGTEQFFRLIGECRRLEDDERLKDIEDDTVQVIFDQSGC